MGDIDVFALVASKMAELTGDQAVQRLLEVRPRRPDGHLPAAHSRQFDEYEGLSIQGPARQGRRRRSVDNDQPHDAEDPSATTRSTDSTPWYTKSGRLELYREEDEFIEAGENLPVHREPVDSTFYEPNVIISPRTRPSGPRGRRITASTRDDLSCETRCGRNVVYTWAEAKTTPHPLIKDGLQVHLPHAEIPPRRAHDADRHGHDRVLFGPFGDVYRHDKRSRRS